MKPKGKYMRLGRVEGILKVIVGHIDDEHYIEPKWSFMGMRPRSLMMKREGIWRCRQTGEVREFALR